MVAYFVLLTGFINSKPFIGEIEVLDSKFNNIVYNNKQIEIITSDVTHANGPLWIEDEASSSSYLMFSDTQENRIYKWEDGKGLFTVGKTIYVENSGCKSNTTRCEALTHGGSAGLLRKDTTTLDVVVCQQGDRMLTVVADTGLRHVLASHFKGRRLNGPHDVVFSPEGHLYFTDPGFGLSGHDQDRELAYSGVYMLKAEHAQLALDSDSPSPLLHLLDDSLTAPAGLAFSPDYSRLYVSSADASRPVLTVHEVADDGSLRGGRVFFDFSALYAQECGRLTALGVACSEETIGLPRGLKVDILGHVFASGPGGVAVLSPEGELLGRLRIPDRPVSNLAFGGDGRLYMTARDVVARVWVRTRPTRIVSSAFKK